MRSDPLTRIHFNAGPVGQKSFHLYKRVSLMQTWILVSRQVSLALVMPKAGHRSFEFRPPYRRCMNEDKVFNGRLWDHALNSELCAVVSFAFSFNVTFQASRCSIEEPTRWTVWGKAFYSANTSIAQLQSTCAIFDFIFDIRTSLKSKEVDKVMRSAKTKETSAWNTYKERQITITLVAWLCHSIRLSKKIYVGNQDVSSVS